MSKQNTADQTREQRDSTSVRVLPSKYRELRHILIDHGLSFSDWLDKKMDEDIDRYGRIAAGNTQIDPARLREKA